MNGIISRRSALRGTVAGAAVAVSLPFLDCFLNNNGTALADGQALPTRFGTWFWGLGGNTNVFIPKKAGADFDLPEEIQVLAPVKQYINVYSNFNVPLDGKPNVQHYSGQIGIRTGTLPSGGGGVPAPSLDVLIADAIGDGSRFASLQMAATGGVRDSLSFRNADAVNPPEVSAVRFYQRVFGAEFQNPNAEHFTPNPRTMIRKSVLSGVADQRSRLLASVGASDRARLDQYFTSVRELEGRLELQLQKPPRAEACTVPAPVKEDAPDGLTFELLASRHKAMTDILTLAVACNQTKVFNMMYSTGAATTTRPGFPSAHHAITHEELPDPKLGYQVTHSWFVRRAMESWAYMVTSFANIKEGEGTLLDRTLIFAHSEVERAQAHTLDGIPMMTAGRAGGRIKSGLHIDGKKEVASRVGLTFMQAMGVRVSGWGSDSMKTDRTITEVLA